MEILGIHLNSSYFQARRRTLGGLARQQGPCRSMPPGTSSLGAPELLDIRSTGKEQTSLPALVLIGKCL